MKNVFFGLLVFCLVNYTHAQVKYETIQSSKLGESRELKIQLPRGYDASQEKRYPLFIVLDGDYLFDPFQGTLNIIRFN